VIVEASNIEAIDKLKKRNYRVHVIDLSEFVKGEGGPSCLILPVERKD
jgi:arginine deiminase